MTGIGERLLYEGDTGPDGTVVGHLDAANWSVVSSEWPRKLTGLTRTVSLELESGLIAFNTTTAEWDEYAYSDAIPFDPWSPPASFNASAFFSLAHPTGTLPGLPPVLTTTYAGRFTGARSAPAETVLPTSGSCGQNPLPAWTTDFDGYVTGPLPVLLVNNTYRPAAGQLDGLVPFAELMWSSSVNLHFTVAAADEVGGSYANAAGPGTSWSGTGVLDVGGAVSVAADSPSAAVGLLYIDNVTIHLLRQTETVLYHVPPTCQTYLATSQHLLIDVTNVTDDGFYLGSATLPQAYGLLVSRLLGPSPRTIANLSTPAGHSQDWRPVVRSAPGLARAEAMEQSVLGAASFFVTPLGLGVAVMDAMGTCAWSCLARDVTTTLAQVMEATGSFAAADAALSSVSYTQGSVENLSGLVLTAEDEPFHFQVLGAESLTEMSSAVGDVQVSTPVAVVAWEG